MRSMAVAFQADDLASSRSANPVRVEQGESPEEDAIEALALARDRVDGRQRIRVRIERQPSLSRSQVLPEHQLEETLYRVYEPSRRRRNRCAAHTPSLQSKELIHCEVVRIGRPSCPSPKLTSPRIKQSVPSSASRAVRFNPAWVAHCSELTSAARRVFRQRGEIIDCAHLLHTLGHGLLPALVIARQMHDRHEHSAFVQPELAHNHCGAKRD